MYYNFNHVLHISDKKKVVNNNSDRWSGIRAAVPVSKVCLIYHLSYLPLSYLIDVIKRAKFLVVN